MAQPEHWTAEEAEAALPRVAALLARLASGDDGLTPQVAAEALAGEGIVLRDPIRGLVDFPAVAPNGRPYWLCWVHGEPSIGWWHWAEEGFAGRRPLEEPPS